MFPKISLGPGMGRGQGKGWVRAGVCMGSVFQITCINLRLFYVSLLLVGYLHLFLVWNQTE